MENAESISDAAGKDRRPSTDLRSSTEPIRFFDAWRADYLHAKYEDIWTAAGNRASFRR